MSSANHNHAAKRASSSGQVETTLSLVVLRRFRAVSTNKLCIIFAGLCLALGLMNLNFSSTLLSVNNDSSLRKLLNRFGEEDRVKVKGELSSSSSESPSSFSVDILSVSSTSDSVARMKANTQRLDDTAETTPFTVDILSVGSINQLDLLHAQLNTIATHTSVRNFFNATELDDADPNCHTDITVEHVKRVSNYCRSRSQWIGPIFRILRRNYGRYEWLQKKKNPTGWLCAQVRPYSGLMKAQLHYKRTGQELPDYFLIFDDDTYYNMELFQQNFASVNSLEERVYSGCLVRLPIHTTNLTFPFGGFGSILSKGALIKLFGRNQCPGLDDTANVNNNINNTEELSTKDSSSAFCGRLKENNAGELKYFTNGMSLVELMYKYTSTDKYRDVNEWWASGSGFCMHSDWVLGYFVNYYNVSKHVANPYYRDVPHARLESYKESEIYDKGTGFCRNDNNCKSNTEICHRATPEWMETETKRWKLMVPNKFG